MEEISHFLLHSPLATIVMAGLGWARSRNHIQLRGLNVSMALDCMWLHEASHWDCTMGCPLLQAEVQPAALHALPLFLSHHFHILVQYRFMFIITTERYYRSQSTLWNIMLNAFMMLSL